MWKWAPLCAATAVEMIPKPMQESWKKWTAAAGRRGDVHVGICTKNKEGVRCKTIAKIMEMLEEKGMEVVDGTH